MNKFDFDHPISILVPVCNEVDVIDGVIQEWLEVLERLPRGTTLEFEDANSKDGTLEILLDYADRFQSIVVHQRPDRDGFSNAVKRLLRNSKNEWMFVADSDGQYYASDIENHLRKWRDGIQFVKGVKVNRQDGLFRRIFSFIINRFIVVYFGFPFLDYNSSHYLIHKELYRKLESEKWFFKYSVNIEITLRAILSNARYEVVYVKHSKRKQGVSRGNPPHKLIGYGLTAIKDIALLKSGY